MDFSKLKRNAREALQGNWGKAIIASLIAGALGSSGGSGGASFDFEASELEGTPFEQLGVFLEKNAAWILGLIGAFAAIGIVVGIAMFMLSCIISTGHAKFNLDLVNSKDVTIGTLFSYFKHWKSLIFANLLSTIYIFLWSLLCVIPGIVASYKYAMLPYILAEEPDLKPQEALDRSTELMQGHKLEFFLFNLSFIGWILLSILSCGIGFIWLSPYMWAAQADFYRELRGKGEIYEDTDYISKFTEVQ